MKFKASRGFTLTEILIAISIVAVLSIIGFSTFNSVEVRARDSKRKEDLKNVQIALQLFYQKNGRYPILDWGDSAGRAYPSCVGPPTCNGCAFYACPHDAANMPYSPSWSHDDCVLYHPWGTYTGNNCWNHLFDVDFGTYQTQTSDYINVMPHDPHEDGTGSSGWHHYNYRSDGQVYILCGQLENRNDSAINYESSIDNNGGNTVCAHNYIIFYPIPSAYPESPSSAQFPGTSYIGH